MIMGSINHDDKPDISDIAAATVSHNSDLRDRIAAVVIRHHTDCDDTTVDGTWTQCECDAGWRSEDEWAVHVADAVTDLLIDMAGKGELLKTIDGMHR